MYNYNGKNVMIMLYSKCNVRCKHCYIKYEGNFNPTDAVHLTTKLQEKYTVSLNGTEPILNKQYFPLFKMCNQHKIMTNGLELIRNPGLIAELQKNDINEIGVSYHFGIHDDLSTVKSEDLIKLIVFLKENNFKVKLMTSLNKKIIKILVKYVKRHFLWEQIILNLQI